MLAENWLLSSALVSSPVAPTQTIVAAIASGHPACTRSRYARTEMPFSIAIFSRLLFRLVEMSRAPSVDARSADQPRLRRALNVPKAIPFSSVTGQAGRPLSNSAKQPLCRFSNAPRSNGQPMCVHRTIHSLLPCSAVTKSHQEYSSGSGARP
jgi:hypothetical protein